MFVYYRSMTTDADRLRQLHRELYAESVISTLRRLTKAESEYVRLNATKQLGRIVGYAEVLPQLQELATNAKSEWIGLQATIALDDYASQADSRPLPIELVKGAGGVWGRGVARGGSRSGAGMTRE